MKPWKYLSIFLGATLFMFGVLKFVNPFKEWVDIQITQSNLPAYSVPLVMLGEMLTGIAFLIPVLFKKLKPSLRIIIIKSAGIVTVFMMAGAIYVHLQPGVPAEVLPAKIKAPYIPIAYIFFAILSMITVRKT